MTLGLSMITNKPDEASAFIDEYGQYFDKIFLTVADKNKTAFNKLVLRYEAAVNIVISYYKWDNNFANARNANLKTIDTDFWAWCDDDDTILHPEKLKDLVGWMSAQDIDVIRLKYDYAQNPQGEGISDHWRERLIRTAYDGKWDAPVHETLQGPPALVEDSDLVVVKHDKDFDAIAKSMERNENILRHHWQETKDPRDAWYLGMTELAHGKYDEAISWFIEHVRTSGSDEDKYRSWCRIADIEWLRGKHDQALYATDEAIKLQPEFPDAYFIRVLIYTSMEQFDKGIEWLKVATAKPVPETHHMLDPTLYEYRGLANGAQCFLFSGRVKEAFRLYNIVKEKNPQFWKDMDDVNWEELFETAYYDQKALDYVKYLLYYTGGNGGKPTKIFESLPERLLADVRLNAERVKFMPKKKWDDKTIAIYCGSAAEAWGPEYLDKGIGGSEEAVVYLSRELTKLGWQVTVFNDREDAYEDYVPGYGGFVDYKPWPLLNPYDEFDVFVSWRVPSFIRSIKARKKLVDFHDVPQGGIAISSNDISQADTFMFKTAYHRSLAKNVPDAKAVVVGNGIARSHFNES